MVAYESMDHSLIGAWDAPGNTRSTIVARFTARVSHLAASLGERTSRAAAGRTPRRTRLARELLVELGSIRSYSQFVRDNPDMPQDHRQRCLDSVLTSCELVDHAVQSLLKGSPGNDRNASA